MSLKISGKATAKQKAMLRQLEYNGRGQYDIDNLNKVDASLLIDDLLEQQKQEDEWEYNYHWENENNAWKE